MTIYVSSAAERVRAAVRVQDPARYHCALFAPPPARAGLFAMIAFHPELANALSRASEPMLARIRLTWWREALDEIAEGRPRRHDVVEALAASLDGPLIDAPLRAMIDAREAEIEAPPPANLAAYRRGVAATAETLAAAMLDHLRRIVGLQEDEHALIEESIRAMSEVDENGQRRIERLERYLTVCSF